MSSFENFVQCRVVTPFTAAATEIGLFAADEPHRLPAEGGGVLVLTDSPYRPSVLEVIRYGRRSGMALYEVSRAQEGTTARDWTGVAFCYQALTAGELAQLLGQKADLSALDELREDAETALDTKVDKIAGKGLSTNDYTTAEKNKLANANLTALVGLTGAADRLPYFTGAGALSLATITAAARTLLAATNAAGQQSALGLFADTSGVMTNASGALTNFVSQLLRSADAAAGRSTLGLGSASLLTATTSITDTTVGRALKVGDGGILGDASILTTDWNTATYNGAIMMGSGAANAPSPGWLIGTYWRHDSKYGTQLLSEFDASGVRLFARNLNNEVWQSPVELLHTGNQLSLGTTPASARTAMGLGTAATASVVTDALDRTPGLLPSVGWLGLGSSARPVPGGDWNNAVVNGAIFEYLDGANAPGPQWWVGTYLRHGRDDLDFGTQMACQFTRPVPEIAYRNVLADVWYPWVKVLHTGNASALPITGSLSPSTDNAVTLGEANKRWSTAHLGTAPIVTSDRDAKQDILPIDDAVLDAWATLGYMQYRLKDAVAAKGEEARIHAGLIAQDIKEAFESAGLDPFRYGVLCYDEWEDEVVEHPAEYEWITVPAVLDDEGNEVEPERQEQGELIKEAWTEVVREAGHRYSVRYEEAFALECALQRRTTQRLEQRLAALEAA